MLPWQQMQREIASLQNTLSQQQQKSSSSKGKGTAARWEMGREGTWIPPLPEERRGEGWVAVEGQGGQGREDGTNREVLDVAQILLCSY